MRIASQRTNATTDAAAPEHQPDEVRDREKEAEEDRDPVPRQIVVVDDKPDRRLLGDGHQPIVLSMPGRCGERYHYHRPMETRRVGREDVDRAARVIAGRLHRTPTLSCRTLGPDVYLKAELLQRTGSFKPRGVLTKLASLTPEKARGVIAASAGNHAAALAFGAALEGTDALVVMFQGASEVKVRAAEAYGATIDLEATGPGDVFERLAELEEETGRVLVHPFDDPLVVAGQGTVGLEILEDVPDVRRIVVPCGGGGLVSGITLAATGSDIEIVAVEPETSRALHSALEAGTITRVEARSVADGLNAPFAGLALDIAQSHDVQPVLVTEDEIAAGFRFLYERAKLACEPAGAAAVAACSRQGRRRSHRLCRLGRERRRPNRRWYPGNPMKADIHPDYVLAHVTCSCGNEFWTRSTKAELHVEICAECHPFYTGKQKLVDTGGRVERFQRRLEKAGGSNRG